MRDQGPDGENLAAPRLRRNVDSRPRPERGDASLDNGQLAFATLETLVRRLVADGAFRDSDPVAMAEAIWAAAHGLVSLLIAMPHFPWSDRPGLVQSVLEMVLRGWMRR